jgi:hypothetical protein
MKTLLSDPPTARLQPGPGASAFGHMTNSLFTLQSTVPPVAPPPLRNRSRAQVSAEPGGTPF